MASNSGSTHNKMPIVSTCVLMDKTGRVVIPKPLRDELRLAPGDVLELESGGDQITLRAVRGTGPLNKEHGVWVFHTGKPLPANATDELLQSIREERDLGNLANDKDAADLSNPSQHPSKAIE
jgi:AbrB family looped-hinge helix DNA binding protein